MLLVFTNCQYCLLLLVCSGHSGQVRLQLVIFSLLDLLKSLLHILQQLALLLPLQPPSPHTGEGLLESNLGLFVPSNMVKNDGDYR